MSRSTEYRAAMREAVRYDGFGEPPVEVAGPVGEVAYWDVENGYQPPEGSPTPVADRQREYASRPVEPKPRMTDAQRDKLWELCGRYNVPFREDDYYFPTDLPDGWVSGWVGGWFPGSDRKKTIYVGVDPEGRSSS